MGARLTWESGEAGSIEKIEGEVVVVRSGKPSAPGSRPMGALESGAAIRVKVHRCRREDGADGLTFTIDGRLIDATKGTRAEIERILGAAAS